MEDSYEVKRSRGLMTATDREMISERSSNDSRRNQSVSRIRWRIEEVETDVEILEENHPELLEELREVVCQDS
ncbi:hypothetical protein SAMN04487948_1369 [Halogranum amylolyticum]|uniref:Uncharacterized protein n=1 Tax=Halogranum amylolyticum TaxID=660520 RepID=A0A1H8WP38_9EURY|nr:hypothetical protein [Halogranum amylolyticum]SEP29450.1 hypothetical protein SAMN04487948_1369 [Halogranum amylolyticum]